MAGFTKVLAEAICILLNERSFKKHEMAQKQADSQHPAAAIGQHMPDELVLITASSSCTPSMQAQISCAGQCTGTLTCTRCASMHINVSLSADKQQTQACMGSLNMQGNVVRICMMWHSPMLLDSL